jgi:hypothetical protein
MYNLDTKEEVDMDTFFEEKEKGEIQIVSRKRTEEEWKEHDREIAEHKAMRQKSKELVFA